MSNKKQMKDVLLEMAKKYIPKEIVMTPEAFAIPLKQEKTIENFKQKVYESFCQEHPQHIKDYNLIEHDVEYIISKRLLIGSTSN